MTSADSFAKLLDKAEKNIRKARMLIEPVANDEGHPDHETMVFAAGDLRGIERQLSRRSSEIAKTIKQWDAK